MAVSSSLTRELNICPYSLVNPHRKAIIISPTFHLNPVFTLPQCNLFQLRYVSKFQNCKFHRCRRGRPALFLQGRVLCLQSVPGRQLHDQRRYVVYGKKPSPGSAALRRLPGSDYWNSAATWCPFLQTRDPQTTLSLLDSAPLCHLSTFTPGISPTITNLKVQIFALCPS